MYMSLHIWNEGKPDKDSFKKTVQTHVELST